jgi:hypothetical protein
MTKASWLLAALCVLSGGFPSRAQFVIGGFTLRNGLGPGYVRNPYAYSRHYWGSGGWERHHSGSAVTRVTYLYYSAPTVVVAPVPLPSARPRSALLDFDEDLDLEIPPAPRVAEAPRALPPLVPGAEASVFRPILPEDRVRALLPQRPDAPPKPMPPAKPAPAKERPQRREPPPLPAPPPPDPNPKAEYARQLQLGEEAFAERAYARAERRFREGALVLPGEAQAQFFLAQAEFALGKYQEAVLAIQEGLRRDPFWPRANYRPRRVYAANSPDYDDQLKRLAEALRRFPDDPFLVFLYAYQLWFDDRQDEARPLFARAKVLAQDPRFADAFLLPPPVWPIFVW